MSEPTLTSLVVIALASLTASGLTLFSGFGLGTLLMPAFALFFPVDAAVALTAIVHLANNALKLGLLGRHADRTIVLRFGLPAILAAFAGAALLESLASMTPLAEWTLGGRVLVVTAVKVVVGAMMVLFAVIEMMPAFERWAVPPRYLPFGGLLSGFFGGLSGHQGAFRSAFLVRSDLSKESFIATGVVIAILVDVTRIPVYAGSIGTVLQEHGGLLFVAVMSAFLGVWLGTRLLKKVTVRAIRVTISVLLVVLGSALATGLL
ncbi:MAG: TSUP family transporter [Bacteroidetes bacterium]|jgi:hypothetical protein|nr:TSUP family transporter [Bacteroidota bacterium]